MESVRETTGKTQECKPFDGGISFLFWKSVNVIERFARTLTTLFALWWEIVRDIGGVIKFSCLLFFLFSYPAMLTLNCPYRSEVARDMDVRFVRGATRRSGDKRTFFSVGNVHPCLQRQRRMPSWVMDTFTPCGHTALLESGWMRLPPIAPISLQITRQ